MAAAGTEAGLFLGTVIVATIPGARRRLRPDGHPVVRLATGRDLDVVAMANDRMAKGAPCWPMSTPAQPLDNPAE
jgi:hypothetical protein